MYGQEGPLPHDADLQFDDCGFDEPDMPELEWSQSEAEEEGNNNDGDGFQEESDFDWSDHDGPDDTEQDQRLAEGATDSEQEEAEAAPTTVPPTLTNPDKWPDHPSGPAGSWLRARVQASWDLAKQITGKDVFARRGQAAQPAKSNKKELRQREEYEEMRRAAESSQPPDKILAKEFHGPLLGYVFTRRDSETGYFRDTSSDASSDAAASNTTANAQDPPAAVTMGPTCISLATHLQMDAARPLQGTQRAERRQRPRQRRKMHGPQRQWPDTTLLKDQTWRHDGLVAVDSLNCNSFPSSEHARNASTADALMLQETKQLLGRVATAMAEALADSWRAAFTPAEPGGANSASAGTAVMVKICHGLDDEVVPKPEVEAHRIKAAWSTLNEGA